MPVQAVTRLVLMAGCLSSGICPTVRTLRTQHDGQHPIAFGEIFPSLVIGGQQKRKRDDLAFSDWGTFLCICSTIPDDDWVTSQKCVQLDGSTVLRSIPCDSGRRHTGETCRHLEVDIKSNKYHLTQCLLEKSK